MWNLEKPDKPIFIAKNVRDDMLQLRVPVWPSDAAFMPDNRTIVTCTRHKHIRLYDPRCQRRPKFTFEWEEPLTRICPHPTNYR